MRAILLVTFISVFTNNIFSADDGLVDHSELIKKLMIQNSNLLSLITEIREQEQLEEKQVIEHQIKEDIPKHMTNPTKKVFHPKMKDECHVIQPKKVINVVNIGKNHSAASPDDTESQLIELMKKQANKYQEVILELEEEESRYSVSAGQRYDMDKATNSSKYGQIAYRFTDKTHALLEVQKREISDIFTGNANTVCIGLKKYFRQKDEKITPYGAVMYKVQEANMGGDLSYDLDRSTVQSVAARLGIECKIDDHAKFDLYFERGGKDDHLLKVDGSTRTLKAEKSVIGMGVNYEF